MFLGLVRDGFSGVPFFKHCTVVSFSLPHWVFGSLNWKGKPIFGHNDAPHNAKRFGNQLRKKTIRIGALTVDMSYTIRGGVPHNALLGERLLFPPMGGCAHMFNLNIFEIHLYTSIYI